MMWNSSCRTYFIRLEKVEFIIASILSFCEKNRVHCGFFQGVGAIEEVTLAHYTLATREYAEKTIKEPLEIVQLNGNITIKDKKPYIHAHITVSDKEMKTHGGHLKEAAIGPTGEIILVALKGDVKRKFSEEIGLNLVEFQ